MQSTSTLCDTPIDSHKLAGELDFFAHVWLITVGVPDSCEELSLASLCDDERLRAAQFGSLKKRSRYCRARVFLRAILSRYTGTAPCDLRFTVSPFGRPELDNGTDLRFNLSHTGETIACIVTRRSSCGIDIEEIARRQYDPHLAARVLARNEQRDIERVPMQMRNEIFLEYWTLKEAYVKAEGRGLAIALDSLAFQRLANPIVRVGVSPEEYLTWRFFCRRLLPGHILSVAVNIV